MRRYYSFYTSQGNKCSVSLELAASTLHKDVFPDDEKKIRELFLFSAQGCFVFVCLGFWVFLIPPRLRKEDQKRRSIHIYLFSFLATHLSNSLKIANVQLELPFPNRWLIKC